MDAGQGFGNGLFFSTTIAFRGLSRAFSNLSARERKDDSGYLLLTRQPPNASHFAIEKSNVVLIAS